jgi:LysR family glycine cleavage system transcriptional activator
LPRLDDHVGARSLASAADLAHHTLAEEDDNKASTPCLSWHRWLALHGQPGLKPRRWLHLNCTHQQVQATLAREAIGGLHTAAGTAVPA